MWLPVCFGPGLRETFVDSSQSFCRTSKGHLPIDFALSKVSLWPCLWSPKQRLPHDVSIEIPALEQIEYRNCERHWYYFMVSQCERQWIGTVRAMRHSQGHSRIHPHFQHRKWTILMMAMLGQDVLHEGKTQCNLGLDSMQCVRTCCSFFKAIVGTIAGCYLFGCIYIP